MAKPGSASNDCNVAGGGDAAGSAAAVVDAVATSPAVATDRVVVGVALGADTALMNASRGGSATRDALFRLPTPNTTARTPATPVTRGHHGARRRIPNTSAAAAVT